MAPSGACPSGVVTLECTLFPTLRRLTQDRTSKRLPTAAIPPTRPLKRFLGLLDPAPPFFSPRCPPNVLQGRDFSLKGLPADPSILRRHRCLFGSCRSRVYRQA